MHFLWRIYICMLHVWLLGEYAYAKHNIRAVVDAKHGIRFAFFVSGLHKLNLPYPLWKFFLPETVQNTEYMNDNKNIIFPQEWFMTRKIYQFVRIRENKLDHMYTEILQRNVYGKQWFHAKNKFHFDSVAPYRTYSYTRYQTTSQTKKYLT